MNSVVKLKTSRASEYAFANKIMKILPLIAFLIFAFGLTALPQTSAVPEPQFIVVDSKDNIFVTLKYGLMNISPDGVMTDLSKQGRDIDRSWRNLIIDSKGNLCKLRPASSHTGFARLHLTPQCVSPGP